MKSFTLPAVLLLLAAGCRSTSSEADVQLTEPELLACVCGQDQGALLGCPHPDCVEGLGNPDNPDCVCGGLAVVNVPALTAVSDGAAMKSTALGTPQTIYLASGHKVRGTLSYDDGSLIRIQLADGSEREYAYDALESRTVYRLLKARHPYTDGPGQVVVGNYARDAGYYAHARRHYEAAVEADPNLKGQVEGELAKLRALAADAELAQAKEAFGKGALDEAEEHLTVILREFPSEEAAGSAAAMLGELRVREATASRSAPDRRSEYADKLEPATKLVQKSVDGNRDGLLSGKSFSKAKKQFERAISDAEKARRTVETLRKKNQDDAGLLQAADQVDRQAVAAAVEADLNLASIHLTRNSYNAALAAVNHAIALDPKNQAARSMRARVELAASRDGWGGGWIIRG